MKSYQILGWCLLLLVTSCNAMPQLFTAVDDIATKSAISVEVDKNAMQKETDVSVNVNVTNKDKKDGVVR